ncbi:MAG: protein kinase [Planctomycetes bacterium]|nr:protein kinase [Planctomycetota bacterium]
MSETNYDTIFGRAAIEQGLCTETELKHCRQELRDRSSERPGTLEEILIRKGYITPSQAKRVREAARVGKDVAEQIPGYKILGKLGAGAMAVVYKATQLSLNRTVAIKILPKRFSEKPDYVKRFYKEGQAAAKLNHNNIVGAFDVGEAGGYHYFVMEYVKGKTLYEDLAKNKVFDEAEAIDIIAQVARALAHAHACGLIHRDVKPKNIMINSAGVVKLADMGLARATDDVKLAESEAGKAYGTPYYIAPEQIRGEVDIDGRADIYSLGVTLYHMVTGRVPFDASTPSEVMRKHLKEPLIPPDHINTTLSSGIGEVIEVMMAKRKEDRYSSAEELLTDLDAVRKGEPPLLARRKFNVDALEQLEKGASFDLVPEGKVYNEDTIARYRLWILLLGSVVAILILVIIFIAATQ